MIVGLFQTPVQRVIVPCKKNNSRLSTRLTVSAGFWHSMGGGAKGFYTLGVLKEIEAMVNCRLHQRFDLIFGSSTGAIIASLLALGHTVDEIHHLYKTHVPAVMRARQGKAKSEALAKLASRVFGDKSFTDVKTGIGIGPLGIGG